MKAELTCSPLDQVGGASGDGLFAVEERRALEVIARAAGVVRHQRANVAEHVHRLLLRHAEGRVDHCEAAEERAANQRRGTQQWRVSTHVSVLGIMTISWSSCDSAQTRAVRQTDANECDYARGLHGRWTFFSATVLMCRCLVANTTEKIRNQAALCSLHRTAARGCRFCTGTPRASLRLPIPMRQSTAKRLPAATEDNEHGRGCIRR